MSAIPDANAAEILSDLIRMARAAAGFHAAGRDPASLQRVDPDIALALRRVWLGDTPPKPRTQTPKTRKK